MRRSRLFGTHVGLLVCWITEELTRRGVPHLFHLGILAAVAGILVDRVWQRKHAPLPVSEPRPVHHAGWLVLLASAALAFALTRVQPADAWVLRMGTLLLVLGLLIHTVATGRGLPFRAPSRKD